MSGVDEGQLFLRPGKPSRGVGTYIVIVDRTVVELIDAASYDEAASKRLVSYGAMYALCGGEPNPWPEAGL